MNNVKINLNWIMPIYMAELLKQAIDEKAARVTNDNELISLTKLSDGISMAISKAKLESGEAE